MMIISDLQHYELAADVQEINYVQGAEGGYTSSPVFPSFSNLMVLGDFAAFGTLGANLQIAQQANTVAVPGAAVSTYKFQLLAGAIGI